MLKLGYVGGLGLMASPAAQHLTPPDAAIVLRVHDRGLPGAQRDSARVAWRAHGAQLVPTLAALAGDDLDGVVVCCGKNGDDLPTVAELARRLGRGRFLLHLSTVSTGFVEAAAGYCASLGVAYANWPLTGGPLGARLGGGHRNGMLILGGGDAALFERCTPLLAKLGHPRFFGAEAAAGAVVKLTGQHMVFFGCLGITSAAALHAASFQRGQLGGAEQVAFFEFLNQGAGGTRQWEVALSKGVRDGAWSDGFLLRHAAVDAIYAAQLALDRGLSRLAVQPMLQIALGFAFLLQKYPEAGLATHALARELLGGGAAELDRFLARSLQDSGDLPTLVLAAIAALPPAVQRTVKLDITLADFERTP